MEPGHRPPITVARTGPLWRWFAIRIGMFLAVMAVVFTARTAGSAAPLGALLGGLLAAGLLAAVELAVFARAAARRQRRLTEAAPPGTLFTDRAAQAGGLVAGPAADTARTGRLRGVLTIDHQGCSFAPSAQSGMAGRTVLAWPQLSRVTARYSRTPLTAILQVTTADGRSVTWHCGNLPRLADALRRLHDESTARPAATDRAGWPDPR